MSHPEEDPPLIAILRALTETVGDRERVLLGEMIDALGRRGFGPVILVCAAMMILPTGVIPFFPAFMGLILMLAGGQMLSGRRQLWLPPRIYGIQLPGQTVRNALARAVPVAERLGRYIRGRLGFLIDGWLSIWAIAVIVFVTSLAIIVIGAIPGLPFLLALHILAIGLGLSTGDGLFVAVGYAIFLPVAFLAGRFAGLL